MVQIAENGPVSTRPGRPGSGRRLHRPLPCSSETPPHPPGIFVILENAMMPARVPSGLLSPAISGFLDLMQPRVGLTDNRQR